MKTGIIDLYYSFIKELGSEEEIKEKLAVLQLGGKLEDYLVKEFLYHIYQSSGGNIFALTNFGRKADGRRIDLVLIKGKTLTEPQVFALVEAKYLRNIQRFDVYADATDEISSSFVSLREQIGPFKSEKYGGYSVQLRALSKNVYGLVFASYVTKEEGSNSKKEEFYKTILDKAEKDFRYHDLKKPYFKTICEDIPAKLIGENFYVSLRAGLWRKR